MRLQPLNDAAKKSFVTGLRRAVVSLDDAHRGGAERDLDTLLSAGVRSAASFNRILCDEDEEDAAVIACWFAPRVSRLRKPTTVSRLADLLSSRSSNLRRAAAVALGEMGMPSAVPSLIKAIGDANAEVRCAVVYALGKLEDKRAQGALLKVLKNPNELPRVRGFAAESLGSLGNPTSVPTLIAAMGDRSSNVRLFCAFALGELKDQRALRALRKVASSDRGRVRGYGTVRQEARRAISAIERGRTGSRPAPR
jgi:HEAT repeat protein